MATQTIEFRAATGQTVTAKLFSAGSDVQVASASATEETNRKGTYTVSYTDIPAGEYMLIALANIIPIASWWVRLELSTAIYQVYDKSDTLGIQSGLATATALSNLDAKVDALGSVNAEAY